MPGEGAPRRDPTTLKKASELPGEQRHDKIVGVDPGIPQSARGPLFGTGENIPAAQKGMESTDSAILKEQKSIPHDEQPVRSRRVIEEKKVIEERPIGEVNGQEVDFVTKRRVSGNARNVIKEKPKANLKVDNLWATATRTFDKVTRPLGVNKRLASALLLGLLLLPAAWWFANRLFSGPIVHDTRYANYAPPTREVHRTEIRPGHFVEDIKDRANDYYHEARAGVKDTLEQAKDFAKETAYKAKGTANEMLGTTKTYRAIGFGDRMWNVYNRIVHPIDYEKYEYEHYQYLEKNYPGRVEVIHSRPLGNSGFIGRFFGNLFGRALPVLLLGLLALSTIPLYFYFRKNGVTGRTVFPRQPVIGATHAQPHTQEATIAVHRPAAVPVPNPVTGYTNVAQVSSKPIVAPNVAPIAAPSLGQQKSSQGYVDQQPIAGVKHGMQQGAQMQQQGAQMLPVTQQNFQQPQATYGQQQPGAQMHQGGVQPGMRL